MKSVAEARIKRARAVELVGQGKSYDEIAKTVGYSHRGSAHRAVSRALDEREVANVDELRELELTRLDALQVSIWQKAMSGDLDAIRTVLHIIDRRIRLLGLAPRSTGPKAASGPAYLVTGHWEGNPGEATMADLERRWAEIANAG